MLNEKIKLENVDEQLLASIYKAMDIYDIIKKTYLKINSELISELDKKYLSLLLGIYFEKNNVSKVLNMLRFDYGIQVYTSRKSENEYEYIYNNYFKELLDTMLEEENNSTEQFMLKLLKIEFIEKLHRYNGLSINSLELILNKMINNEKPKTLQKK